jgi:hypothetical protein
MAAIGQKGLPVTFGTFASTLALLYAGFLSANARGAYAPAPAYGPSRRYARRAYRSARRTYGARTYGTRGAPPATYAGNTAFTPGSGGQPYAVTPGAYAGNSAQPNEWYGPMRRGNMCTTHVDINRGYEYQAACKK